MKAGDLVKPGPDHGLKNMYGRESGIIIEYLAPKPNYNEAVIVRWNDGDVELEVPKWLEIINESR
tara:strand:- start:1719 stop:1913 length:195 start_codon:yes stop_codon:yes gene_type:complete